MDLISREALVNDLCEDREEGTFEFTDSQAEAADKIIVYVTKRINAQPSIPAVPLVTLLKFIEQTEHFTYPPCQNEIEKCRDCKLHYTFDSQKECWKQFLTKLMEEQDAQTEQSGK